MENKRLKKMGRRLRAKVKRVTGKTVHGLGTIVEGKPVMTERLLRPAWVEILEEDSIFYLLHFAPDSQCIADTWHATIDEAKQQAFFEFEICEEDWETV